MAVKSFNDMVRSVTRTNDNSYLSGSMVAKVRKRLPDSSLPSSISSYQPRVRDVLGRLQCDNNVYSAIELVTTKHPDASMAAQSYVRLCNTGHEMEIYYPDSDERNKDAERLWREIASQFSFENTMGVDGLVEQCHDSLVRFGGFGIEIVVEKNPLRVTGMHPILPQWITWDRNDNGDWIPYQQQGNRKVDLSTGNFFWATMGNEVGKPIGKKMLEGSLMAIENQLKFHEDINAVLRRAGYPRNDFSIDRKALIESSPPEVRRNSKALTDWMTGEFDRVVGMLKSLEPTDDFVHFDEVEVNKTGGDNSRSIDLRAFTDMVDAQVVNGLQSMGILLNRTTGTTETWGTVQYKILLDGVDLAQRSSKRMFEQICEFVLQVYGIPGYCKMKHNPLDVDNEKTKLENAALKQTYYRKAEEYGWMSKPEAAKSAMGLENIPTEKPDHRAEFVKNIKDKNNGSEVDS